MSLLTLVCEQGPFFSPKVFTSLYNMFPLGVRKTAPHANFPCTLHSSDIVVKYTKEEKEVGIHRKELQGRPGLSVPDLGK